MTHLSPKIKILILGEEYHAKAFYEQLKNYKKGIFEPKYISDLNELPQYSNIDLFHLISTPLPVIKRVRKFHKPIFYHWIGTDVYRFMNDSYIKQLLKKLIIRSPLVNNLVVWDNLKDELSSLKIESTVLPLVKFSIKKDIPPLPAKFSVLSYVPYKRWEFFHGDTILKLAEEFPDIDFHLLAAKGKIVKLSNVHTYGFVKDVNPFYKNNSVLLRITKHDGLAKMVLEALSFGRHVLWNVPFPHCTYVNNLDDFIGALNTLKKKNELNLVGKAFVEQNFNRENILDNYYNLCKNLTGNESNEVKHIY